MKNNALLIRHAFARHLLRWRRLTINRRICGSGATTAMAFFDEPICSAHGMPPMGLSQATSTAGGHDLKILDKKVKSRATNYGALLLFKRFVINC